MICAILLLASPLFQQPLACLDDGTRVQVLSGTEVGSYMVRTSLGVLRTEGQRISELTDSAEEVALLEPLRDLDYDSWVKRLGERGMFERLMKEHVNRFNREQLFAAIMPWGARIDPLPPGFPVSKRAEELWVRLQAAEGCHRALIFGAMVSESEKTGIGYWRNLSMEDVVKAMDHADPGLRWAAVNLATMLDEEGLEEFLLETSMQDLDIWVFRTAGQNLLDRDTKGALYRWAYVLIDSRDIQMHRRASFLLGELGRYYPDILAEIAELLRASFVLGGGSGAGGPGCPPPTGISLNGAGIAVTEGSTLEDGAIATTQQKLVMADVLERVITPGSGGKKHLTDRQKRKDKNPRPNFSGPEGESLETQSEAWRKYLQGR
ncbi:MAG: hypothetical protein COA70_05755 [Planctomycetota bacterium]|nr:MAG: hypothetical protein COA70_05755 [Planctomycetota bacterium]